MHQYYLERIKHFRLLFGVYSRLRDDPELTEMLLEEMSHEFDKDRNDLREQAHKNLQKIQHESQRRNNHKRKEARRYKEDDQSVGHNEDLVSNYSTNI